MSKLTSKQRNKMPAAKFGEKGNLSSSEKAKIDAQANKVLQGTILGKYA